MERALADKLTRGQYFVQPEYESILLANQLTGGDDFLALAGGTVVRSVPGRTTRRIELKSPDGSSLAAYLKCYEGAPPWPCRWFGLTGRLKDGLESLNEWRQILALRQLGFRTAAPIAAGWQHDAKTGKIHSFVMTAEVGGAVPGIDYWAKSNDSKRRNLIRRIAELARRFHQAGFIHKDFYLAHLFVTERNNELELTLIDLQRVLGPRRFHVRWQIKDIGSMMYSLERVGAKRLMILRLFKLYRGGGRSRAADRRFLGQALRRVGWLHGRTPKYGESRPQ